MLCCMRSQADAKMAEQWDYICMPEIWLMPIPCAVSAIHGTPLFFFNDNYRVEALMRCALLLQLLFSVTFSHWTIVLYKTCYMFSL